MIRARLALAAALVGVALLLFGGDISIGPVAPPAPTAKPVAAVYVFEKDDGMPSAAIRSALDRINRETSVIATQFDDDTLDGDGQTPEQYRLPLEAAIESGIPALVVVGDDGKVLRVVKNPTTEREILEAVK